MTTDYYKAPPINAKGRSTRDLRGKRFGELIVLGYHERHRHKTGANTHWWCKCWLCKRIVSVIGGNLRGSKSTRCNSCAKTQAGKLLGKASKTHGLSRVPLYMAWRNAKNLGILCDEWAACYETFSTAIGRRPSNAQLRRYNPSKPFGPTNWMWLTADAKLDRAVKKLQDAIGNHTPEFAAQMRKVSRQRRHQVLCQYQEMKRMSCNTQ